VDNLSVVRVTVVIYCNRLSTRQSRFCHIIYCSEWY